MDLGFILTNAIMVACIYGLIAVAVSITWSSLGLVNLGYGFIFAFSGYGAYVASRMLSDHPAVVLAAGILSGAARGRRHLPARVHPPARQAELHGTGNDRNARDQPHRFPGPFVVGSAPATSRCRRSSGTWKVNLGDVVLTSDKIGIVVCSTLMLLFVVRWMKSSRRGLEIRAMMMNPHAASIVGIGIRRTGFYVMAITGAMAGLSARPALPDLLHRALQRPHSAHQGE